MSHMFTESLSPINSSNTIHISQKLETTPNGLQIMAYSYSEIYYSRVKTELVIYAIWMKVISNILSEKAGYKIIDNIWFNFYELLEKTKAISSDRNWITGLLDTGETRWDSWH